MARLIASLAVASLLLGFPGPASAFGTIEGGGQHREHERITRAAVACPGGDCFEPRSVDQLAGHGKGFGAVGSPDLTEVSNPAAHCDDADYLAGDYPQTRDEATARLLELRRPPPCPLRRSGRRGQAGCSTTKVRSSPLRWVWTPTASWAPPNSGPSAGPWRRSAAPCTGRRTSTRTATGPTWRIRPARSAPTIRRASHLPAPSPVLDLRGSGDAVGAPRPDDRVFRARATASPASGCANAGSPMPASTRTTGWSTRARARTRIRRRRAARWRTTSRRPSRERWWRRAISGTSSRPRWRTGTAARKASLMACALTHDDPVNDCRAALRAYRRRHCRLFLVVLVIGVVWFRRRRARDR